MLNILQELNICKTLETSFNEMKDRTGIVHRAASMVAEYNNDMGARADVDPHLIACKLRRKHRKRFWGRFHAISPRH